MENDIRFYSIISILAILSIASILTLSPLLIITSLAVSGLLIVFYRLHYLVDSVIFRRTNMVQMLDGCEISGERTAAVRRVGGKFCATAASLLESRESNTLERDKIENIIANSHCPFRFVVHVERVNVNKMLDRLLTKRNMREIEIGRLEGSSVRRDGAKIAALKRELEQLEHDINKIGAAGSPLKISQYILTSAVSESKFAAQERARSQIRELSSEFGAVLGSSSEILSGGELVRILQFDSTVMQ